jgi:hypothetical protein
LGLKKSSKSVSTIILIGLILFSTLSLTSIIPKAAANEPTLNDFDVIPYYGSPHDPIVIQSDSEFTAQNGVNCGSGIQSDPYVIEYWKINAEGNIGIYISGTTSYFVVRNCLVTSGSTGIYVKGSNGIIESNKIIGDSCWTDGYEGSSKTGMEIDGDNIIVDLNVVLNIGTALSITGSGIFVYWNDFVNYLSISVEYDSDVIWYYDDGVSGFGNYWDEYSGSDVNQDGVGDTPFIIDPNNQDSFPLIDIVNSDIDLDGVYDEVDPWPLEHFTPFFSDYFTFNDSPHEVGHYWGVVHTEITNIGYTVKDAPFPYGVQITTQPAEEGRVFIMSGDGNFTLQPATSIIATFGSEHVKVVEGTVRADFLMADGENWISMTLNGGDEVVFDKETGILENNGLNAIVVLALNSEFTIEPGDTFGFVTNVVPPLTSAALSSPSAPIEGWYQSNIEVTLIAIDPNPSSGIAETSYSFDNINWINYDSPFTVTKKGTTTIYYRSVDSAGNFEPTKTIVAQIAVVTSGNQKITLLGSGNGVIITDGNCIIDAKQATATTIIKTGNGNNMISLGEGDNTVKITGNGNDIITAGNGDNLMVISGKGDRQIVAGNGNDNIALSGTGNNIVNAGNGDNKVTVGYGNNQILTGSGDDVVVAGNGNNNIKTGNGNDHITVGNGNNYVDGGQGVDSCNAGKGKNKIINCEIWYCQERAQSGAKQAD